MYLKTQRTKIVSGLALQAETGRERGAKPLGVNASPEQEVTARDGAERKRDGDGWVKAAVPTRTADAAAAKTATSSAASTATTAAGSSSSSNNSNTGRGGGGGGGGSSGSAGQGRGGVSSVSTALQQRNQSREQRMRMAEAAKQAKEAEAKEADEKAARAEAEAREAEARAKARAEAEAKEAKAREARAEALRRRNDPEIKAKRKAAAEAAAAARREGVVVDPRPGLVVWAERTSGTGKCPRVVCVRVRVRFFLRGACRSSSFFFALFCLCFFVFCVLFHGALRLARAPDEKDPYTWRAKPASCFAVIVVGPECGLAHTFVAFDTFSYGCEDAYRVLC